MREEIKMEKRVGIMGEEKSEATSGR